jgi:hypothetical protein
MARPRRHRRSCGDQRKTAGQATAQEEAGDQAPDNQAVRAGGQCGQACARPNPTTDTNTTVR